MTKFNKSVTIMNKNDTKKDSPNLNNNSSKDEKFTTKYFHKTNKSYEEEKSSDNKDRNKSLDRNDRCEEPMMRYRFKTGYPVDVTSRWTLRTRYKYSSFWRGRRKGTLPVMSGTHRMRFYNTPKNWRRYVRYDIAEKEITDIRRDIHMNEDFGTYSFDDWNVDLDVKVKLHSIKFEEPNDLNMEELNNESDDEGQIFRF